MHESGYFGDLSLWDEDSFDRLAAAGIACSLAGENLAIGPSPEQVHEQMLASSSHRANILKRDYCRVGIGMYDGPYGLMVTEVFIGDYPYGVPPSESRCL